MAKENLKTLWMQGLLMAAVVATAVPLPDLVWASNDLGSATAGAATQFNGVLKVLNYVAYTVGTVLCISGVMKLKHHAENQTSTPISHGVARLGAGAALLALPFLGGLLFSSAGSITGEGNATFTQLPTIQ